MKRWIRYGLLFLAGLAVAGCGTIKRARQAQEAIAVATNDVPTVDSTPLPRVNLRGARLVNFVEFGFLRDE